MRSAFPFSKFGRVLGAGALSGALIAACSAAGNGSQSGDTESGSSGNPGGVGAGTPGGAGTGGDTFIPSGAGGSTGNAGGGDSCAATVNKAQAVPLDMYIMMDQSGSMSTDDGAGARYTVIKNALTSFLQQPTAAGIGVGIQYFPISSGLMCPVIPFCATNADCGPAACGPCVPPLPGFPGVCQGSTGGDSCTAADYALPDVPIAPLPAVATSIINSLNAHGPTGGTPTSAALQGAIDYAKQWAIQNPSHTVINVFATDGEPSGCNEDINVIKGIAASGVNGTPSIKTFVIGVGSLALLNGIAQSGGTNAAFLIDANPQAGDEFLKAMNEIRGSALACGYLIPQPPPGENIDYGAINVQYTPAGGMPTLIPKVSGPIACPADGSLAWYYDNAIPPTQILLCESTCSTISKDTMGQVNVLVGCETVAK